MKTIQIGRKTLQVFLHTLYFIVGMLIGLGVLTVLMEARPEAPQTLMLMVCLLLSFGLQRLIHLLGHWLLGRLSGLRLLVFSFGHRAWVREGKRFRRKEAPFESYLGNCLMTPSADESVSYSAFWLGGSIFNLIFALAALLALGLLPFSLGSLAGCFLFTFFWAGIWIFLFTGLPLQQGKLPNDAKKAILLLKNPTDHRDFEQNMLLLSYLSEGKRIDRLPASWMRISKSGTVTPFSASLLLRQYELYFLQGDQQTALDILAMLYQNLDALPEEWQIRIWQECIFCLSFRQADAELANSLMNKQRRRRYEEMASAESLRCLCTWAYYIKKDLKTASAYEEAADQAACEIAFRPMAEAWQQIIGYFRQLIQN